MADDAHEAVPIKADLESIASELRKWAQANRMLAGANSIPTVNEPLIQGIFSSIGLKNAASIFQDRGISYIGVNDESCEIVIFLQRPPRIKDQKVFQGLIGHNVVIAVAAGGLGHAGKLPPSPQNVPPFVKRGQFYTCGSSIYLSTERGAGTLACLVKDSTGTLYGLSNNHVTGGCNYAELTLPISAPGQADISAGQPDPFTIGHHYSNMPFVDGLPSIVRSDENIDAALFRIADPDKVSSYQQNSFDTPAAVAPLRANMDVMKVGRTTGLTIGKVVARFPDAWPVQYDVDMTSGRKIIYFTDLFAIKNDTSRFAMPGDSGSLVVTAKSDKHKESVGIVVATSDDGLTLALSLDRVLSYFNVSIVSGHNI